MGEVGCLKDGNFQYLKANIIKPTAFIGGQGDSRENLLGHLLEN